MSEPILYPSDREKRRLFILERCEGRLEAIRVELNQAHKERDFDGVEICQFAMQEHERFIAKLKSDAPNE